jgi:transmembrane sensor
MTRRPFLPQHRPDDAALLRFISGESPLAESENIREWLAADPALAESVEELRAAWSSAEAAEPQWDKAGVWNRIAAETRSVRPPAHVPRFAVRPRRQWASLPIAATLTLMIGGGAAVLWQRSPASVAETVTMREVVTSRGQQAVLDLPDGSRVTLAADSKLRIPSNFDVQGRNARRRELELVGRAYFEVTHDATRPFIVHTATATTEDVGTAFVISAYPETRATQVVVAEGSVALHDPANKGRDPARAPLMVLTRGDAATMNASGTATLTRNADVERYTSWMEGVLPIDGARLRDAIPELERWFDVDIRLADPGLGERRLTAQLRSEPVAPAVERLALILGVQVHVNGRIVTFAPFDSNGRE